MDELLIMSKGPESILRDHISKKLNEMLKAGDPINFRKVLGSVATNGEPDWDIVYCGIPIKLEAKAPDGVVSKLQRYKMLQWAKAGCVVGVVRSVEDVLAILDIVKKDIHEMARFRERIYTIIGDAKDGIIRGERRS